jgi:PPM family protein phosphatase
MSGGAPAVADQLLGAREAQEDSVLLREVHGGNENGVLIVLADGMGGHVGGEIASRLCVHVFADTFAARWQGGNAASALSDALIAANDSIGAKVAEDASLRGMGCTVIGALVTGAGIQWVSVGDSPMWVWSQGEGLVQINDDHSMGGAYDQMVAQGRMSAEEALAQPNRNALRSALVGEPLALVDLAEVARTLAPGSIVIAASDGVETLSDAAIGQLAAQNADPTILARNILSAVSAANSPHQDNATLAIVRDASSWGATGPITQPTQVLDLPVAAAAGPATVINPAVQAAPSAPQPISTASVVQPAPRKGILPLLLWAAMIGLLAVGAYFLLPSLLQSAKPDPEPVVAGPPPEATVDPGTTVPAGQAPAAQTPTAATAPPSPDQPVKQPMATTIPAPPPAVPPVAPTPTPAPPPADQQKGGSPPQPAP